MKPKSRDELMVALLSWAAWKKPQSKARIKGIVTMLEKRAFDRGRSSALRALGDFLSNG